MLEEMAMTKKAEAKPEKAAREKEKPQAKAAAVQPKGGGKLSVRGNVFVGIVKSAKAQKTVTVQRDIVHYVQKYERFKKSRSKIYAHNPDSLNAKEGDTVKVGETRQLSKTKSFVVLEVLKRGEKQ